MNQDQVKEYLRRSFTLKGRMFFPSLLEPKETQSGRMQYSVMFAWGFNENAQVVGELGKFIAGFKAGVFPTIPDQYFVNPVKKYGVYQRQDGKPVADFLKDSYWLNAGSGADFPPAVVDQYKQPVINPADIYSGRNCVINVSFYKIDKEKKGLGCNVKAVMLQEGGEAVTGGGPVDVDKVFGDFASDMNATDNIQSAQGQADQSPTQQQNNVNSFL